MSTKRKRRKVTKGIKKLRMIFKVLLVLIFLALMIALIKDLLSLMEWNEFLIKRVHKSDAQVNELQLTVERLQNSLESLQIQNATLDEANLKLAKYIVETERVEGITYVNVTSAVSDNPPTIEEVDEVSVQDIMNSPLGLGPAIIAVSQVLKGMLGGLRIPIF